MKKTIALLLVVCCFVAVSSLSVAAESVSNDIDFIVNTNGEKVDVDVETSFACGSIQGALLYDDLTFNSVNFADTIESNNKYGDSIRNISGATTFALVGDVENGTNGKWATISFDGTNSKFNFSSLKAYSVKGEKLETKVYIVFRGDANTDGTLDIRDLVALEEISLQECEIEEIYKKNTDVNCDGEYNTNADMIAFKKFLLGL